MRVVIGQSPAEQQAIATEYFLEAGHDRDRSPFANQDRRDAEGCWFRSYGNENWEFAPDGLMQRRIASINDLPISESERKFRWPQGRRPDDHPGLSDFEL